MIKSPSDMTIYRPAVRRGGGVDQVNDQISNFVKGIRVHDSERYHGDRQRARREVTPRTNYEGDELTDNE